MKELFDVQKWLLLLLILILSLGCYGGDGFIYRHGKRFGVLMGLGLELEYNILFG